MCPAGFLNFLRTSDWGVLPFPPHFGWGCLLWLLVAISLLYAECVGVGAGKLSFWFTSL